MRSVERQCTEIAYRSNVVKQRTEAAQRNSIEDHKEQENGEGMFECLIPELRSASRRKSG